MEAEAVPVPTGTRLGLRYRSVEVRTIWQMGLPQALGF
jgi:hypothetical protein